MKYPRGELYETLYAKYINEKNLFEMMDLAGDYKGKNFLDICAGTGRATIEALNRGVDYCAIIDKEKDMVSKNIVFRSDVTIYFGDVREAFGNIEKYGKDYDIAFCRQGVNYWLDQSNVTILSNIMNKGGVFVFNTFNTKPSIYPMTKEYQIDKEEFVEISYLVKNTVHHVQVREGYAPHITEFKWISPEKFKKYLEIYFEVNIITKGKTDIYICRKK